MLILILLSLILATSANPFHTLIAPAENDTNNSDRLPSTTIPSKYFIDIEVPNDSLNGKNVSFNGNVKIKFRVLEPTSKIYLHSAVTVSNISLTDSNNNHIPIINSNRNTTTNILMILFRRFLSPSVKYCLKIFYTQNFTTDTIKGCSRIEYDDNGKKEYLVITQFQHSYARFAFPCFDEPGFKAVFTLRMTHPKEYMALSNMPVKERFINNDTKTTLFQESPKMSSYLVAFTISKLTCTESEQRDVNIQFRVCTRDKFSSDRTLALEYAIKIIKAMTGWTNYSYSLGNSKIDEVVVPGITDLAMENWGMITYHEYMILYNENDTSNDFKQGIIEITAHEFAHQWFGNLVTTSWWNTLFLNEAFATYFQYKLFNWIGLEHYEMDKQFIIKQQQIALSDDSYSDAQSLSSEASTDDDIEDKFGTITYSKGASVITMIANFMGQKNFQQGLQRYLNRNDFQCVTPDKLWDSFNNLGKQYLPDGLNLAEIVDNWINKRGFPLVSATLNENDVKLSQKQFSYDDETNTQWYVPITYLTSKNNRIGIVWLKPHSTVVLKNVIDNGGWIIINHNARGYYRVKYDNVLSRRLRTALTRNPSRFTDLDKTQIIDDTFSLALAGQLKYMEVFQIIRFLKDETSYYPWDATIRGFNQIRLKFDDDSDIVHHINSVLLNLIENNFVDISATIWNNMDHIFGLKSSLIWEATCKAAHKNCISLTKSLFQRFKDDNFSINPNIRPAVYCNALRYSEDIKNDWNFLWNKSLTIDQPHERIYLLESLGCTNNKDLLKFYINESLNRSPLEFEIIWGSVHRSSSTGLNIAFDYFVNNHKKIMKHYSPATETLASIIDRLSTQAQITKLKNFINELHEDSEVKSVAKNSFYNLRSSMKIQSRIKTHLESYFGIHPSIVTLHQ